MQKFGSTGIVTGYIKQLLATFNLPITRIYTEEHARYLEEHGYESPYILESFENDRLDKRNLMVPINEETANVSQVPVSCRIPYIKDGRFQSFLGGHYTRESKFIPGKWQSAELNVNNLPGGPWITYDRGGYYPNSTKTLQVKNNVYDSYTHEYLGDYLRFLRDYDGLNLMPLYNCFSNNLCSGRSVVKHTLASGAVFDSSDMNYKLYMVPVKLFKNYTIAIDADYPIEFFCGLYTTKLDVADNDPSHSEYYKALIEKTYRRESHMCFNKPILFTALTDIAVSPLPKFPVSDDIKKHLAQRTFIADIAQREGDLKLFIKVPKEINSSIVILEGDYRGWNDFVAKKSAQSHTAKTGMQPDKVVIKYNHTVIGNEAVFSDVPMDLISSLQLLRFNTRTQMPFADRLLEYLLDNCVTGGDSEVRENVLMAQYIAKLRYSGESKVMPMPQTEEWEYEPVARPRVIKYDMLNGVWDSALQRLLYRYSTDPKRASFRRTHDVLGYVDKDIESTFTAVVKTPKGNQIKKTMLTFNAWEDIKD